MLVTRILLVVCLVMAAVLTPSNTVTQVAARLGFGTTASASTALLTPPTLAVQTVAWTNLVNCVVTGEVLKKTAGWNDSPDAGATSQQRITAGDGYIEFMVDDVTKERYVGLTNNASGTGWNTINYAVHLVPYASKGGYVVEVREKGVYKSETIFVRGTILRIAVENGVVNYYKDGALYYRSSQAPAYPLSADVSLINLNATVAGLKVALSGASTAPSPSPTVTTKPSPSPTVTASPTPTPKPADTTAPKLSGVTVTNITTTGATVTWTTDEDSSSVVQYGTTTSYGKNASVATMLKAHVVTLTALTPKTLYNYRVRSADASANVATSANFTFTTLNTTTADTTPPAISALTSSNVTASGATISWTTNESADSMVEYGTTATYGNVSSATSMVTAHSMNLIGLPASTMIYYRVKSKDAAGNQATSAGLTLTTTAPSTGGGGSSVAGMLDDNKIHLPANYANFTLPAVGGSYKDPMYGSLITRVTNGVAQFNDGVHHEYAVPSPFNKGNNLVVIATHSKGYYVADRSGKVVCQPAEVNISNMGEPRWSITDPNVFYFHEGNQLKKYDVATKQKSVVKTFSQFGEINFGMGETDISMDGDHMIIIGDDSVVGLYTFSTGTLGKTAALGNLGAGFDHCDVTAKNNIICRFNTNGTGRYQGYELYDANMNFIRQAFPWGAHSDRGLDTNGDEVLIIAAYNDPNPPPGCENNGVEKVSLSTGKKTCLVGLYWNSMIHISSNTDGKNPWVVVSATEEGATSAASLPSNWQQSWGVRYNELLMVKIDGSEVRRLAHHYSRRLNDYWYAPRAAVSRDGRYVLFDSNYGTSPMRDYTDVFLLDLAGSTLNVTRTDDSYFRPLDKLFSWLSNQVTGQ